MSKTRNGGADRPRVLAVVGCVACAVACNPEPAPDARNADARPDHDSVVTAADARDAALVETAEGIVAFLRGEAALDPTVLADTVTLHVAPEGGGASRRVPGSLLRDRASWSVGGRTLTPFAGAAVLTTRAGRHLNCLEYPLSARDEELARLPHVGTSLRPDAGGSCLQTWNLTLVFAAGPGPPRLVAALYDQWEW